MHNPVGKSVEVNNLLFIFLLQSENLMRQIIWMKFQSYLFMTCHDIQQFLGIADITGLKIFG